MFLRKSGENWYVCRRTTKGFAHKSPHYFRNWFLIKWNGKKLGKKPSIAGILCIKSITFPKQFVGKKIRLKVEVIDEK